MATETSGQEERVEPKSYGSSTFCQFIVLILTGVLALYATDVIEITADFSRPVGASGTIITDGEVQGIPITESKRPEDVVVKPKKETEPGKKDVQEGANSQPVNLEHRRTYKRRGQPRSDDDRQAMTEKWGSWTVIDDKERPTDDYYATYPTRDIPRADFPSNAWQIDKDYLSKFLPESIALVQRAQEAILAEYGKTEGSWEERAKMFEVTAIDEASGADAKNSDAKKKGGWTTKKSWAGLKRRLLHAIMTEDNFIFAMGGHSAAAGHGNHFQQSYTLQVQWILEAVFARMGVKHEARNFGNGGLGTAHNGIGAGSIYGPDVDMLMWDSGMTELRDVKAVDLMHRQGLLGGIKVPVLWSLAGSAKLLNVAADVDIGFPGSASYGIQVGSSLEDLNNMTWAMQYLQCEGELKSICNKNEYNGTCWIDRDDVTPPTGQKPQPGGRANWHPGNRVHQLQGRVLAFTILQALKEVLNMWNEAENYVLADNSWHVSEYYESTRQRVVSSAGEGKCNQYEDSELGFACRVPMKARTEFTPRAYPSYSNMRTLMHPDMRAEINDPAKNFYDPPDVFNPYLHPPASAVDVLSIVEAGVDFKSVLVPDYTSFYKTPSFSEPPSVTVGKGYRLDTMTGDAYCDGSVNSFCNKGKDHSCLLYGHNDNRNGYLHHSYSGWMVLNLPEVKYGHIVIKLESWHSEQITKTDGWKEINGATNTGNSTHSTRRLKPKKYCDNFQFEYSIDGNVTTLNLEQWNQKLNKIQRVVETVTLLNNPSFTGGEEKQVEVAVRMLGCQTIKVFKITHVYWA